MDARSVRTTAEAKALVEERGLSHVKLGIVDLDGVIRGKYLARDKFVGALEAGFSFCDIVFGWDSNDQMYDNGAFTGWHTAFPDAIARIDPSTCRDVPTEENMLFFLGEFEGAAAGLCPRRLLRRVIDRAEAMGFSPSVAAEFEFFVFDETPHSVREKGFRGLKNLTPGWFGYSMLRASVESEFHRSLLKLCNEMDMPVEGLHTETGPGVLEAAIQYTDALAAADRAVLFKTFSKVWAERQGKMLTFMAKWSNTYPGQSGHLHLSLRDRDGKPVFHQGGRPGDMSDIMRWFVGGQQALLPELLAMVASTVNSYSRLIPGFWAPTDATWGIENRTCALRVIPGKPSSQRVEYRVAAADINPYLAIAAALGSGLWGIEHRIEPDEPITGNAYERMHPPERAFPRTLSEAADRLVASQAARNLFGDVFVDHYAMTRQWEEREFRKAITDWELARYFEII
ncbi:MULTISPECIES: glutamine synthetase family protein [Bradyrhizobium]|uniref:Glutamine synthetase n=1 Tax=Bradyrhizobium elkanii TaxID=29448 RepID=A0A8I1YC00_BRAEL|nr:MULTISPECIES: glutamine synthetase [Bradyrhizobium]MBP1295526.1 glutamine synthetase [Bradyrhizobium elkanii]MCP1933575.1 glutamine synthetase [Bradyrhizobium elkanii]MCP1967986.1 glutamine synthetase [Bradyrhizobium elkanii]MCS3478416.1 glutamine synthetase [Bradyrhizobium elkanii]MCS3585189.1 glutamine synthetase [Bradyrhizobium elkanii]